MSKVPSFAALQANAQRVEYPVPPTQYIEAGNPSTTQDPALEFVPTSYQSLLDLASAPTQEDPPYLHRISMGKAPRAAASWLGFTLAQGTLGAKLGPNAWKGIKSSIERVHNYSSAVRPRTPLGEVHNVETTLRGELDLLAKELQSLPNSEFGAAEKDILANARRGELVQLFTNFVEELIANMWKIGKSAP